MSQVIDTLAAIWQTGTKIVFLGVGSPLRGDDAIGLYVVAELERALAGYPEREVRFYLGEAAPENFSGAIREFAPTHIIIVDAAQLGEAPGAFKLVEPEQIGGISFTTHALPLKILVKYFLSTIPCQVLIIGVQPKSLDFANPLSTEVKEAVNQFVASFKHRIA
jgi:hydrogenase 3 maturation protease